MAAAYTVSDKARSLLPAGALTPKSAEFRKRALPPYTPTPPANRRAR